MGKSKSSSWSAGGGAKAAGAGRRRGPAAIVGDEFALSGSDDERDDFANKADRISLSKKKAGAAGSDSEDDGLHEEVFGLDAEDSDGEEDSEDAEGEGEEEDWGDEDDDALIEKALEKGGRMGELAKQAKAIGAKLKLQRTEDDDDEEEEEQPGEHWGGNKKRYYDADTMGMEGSDAEDALQEEEEEVGRMEKEKAARMKAADFGVDDEDEEDGDSEDEEEEEDGEATLGALAKGKSKPKDGGRGGVEVEAVAKQLGALSAEERQAALLADAPELLALLQDLTDSLKEVRQRVGPVLQEVRAGGLATAEGISYLEAKHILLLQYCTHIVFYIMLKAEGRPVKDHPVISRLVELRAYMEKIRPIDKRLQYQIERLIKAAQVAAQQEAASGKGKAAEAGGEDDEDAMRFGPRRDQLVAKAGTAGGKDADGGDAAAAGVYRPPKINPVTMEGDEERAAVSKNEARLLNEARRKASRSALVRELAEEVAGAPRELRSELPGFDSMAAVKHRQRLEARAAMEEEMMTRVPLSKEEAKKLKQQQRSNMAGKAMLDDFADEVADIVNLSQADTGAKGTRLSELFSRQKVSQKFGAEAPKRTLHGGDEDLPRREPLHERRLKYDSVAAKRSAKAAELYGDDDDGAPDSEFFGGGAKRRGARAGEEDDFYQETKAAAADKKRARQDKFAAPAMPAPLPDETVAGTRGITTEIEKNRGLTPHRRKDLKNPRKKHRLAFQKAQVRRKGAVQDVREPTSTYGGEATGVKARVVKSRRLG